MNVTVQQMCNPGVGLCGWIAVMVAGCVMSFAASAADPPSPALAFTPAGPGAYAFDTGLLRGRLGPPGKGNGLSAVVHVPTGLTLDRGERGHGLFSHYRVFSNGQRYGAGAWDWPKETRLLPDGAVELRWRATEGRPFALRAVYRWTAPDALDLLTEVAPDQDVTAFEVFLASYFAEAFTNALICAQGTESRFANPALVPAAEEHGLWQMFPRDAAAVKLITDGRWHLPPNPVAWEIQSFLTAPIAVRRAPVGGVTAVLMALPTDSFAIATPHQREGHYSTYFSLGGKDIAAGQTLPLRARLWVAQRPTDQEIVAHYRRWLRPGEGPP